MAGGAGVSVGVVTRLWVMAMGVVMSCSLWAEQSVAKNYQIGPAPSWVLNQSFDDKISIGSDQAVAALLDDTQVHLGKSKERFYRRVLKPLTAAGLSDVSELRLRYNPDYQRLILHSVRIGREGRWRDVARSVRVRMMQREEGLDEGIHDGVVTAVVILEDVRVGDVVDYSYSLNGENPIFGAMQFGGIGLNANYSIEKLSARLIADRKRKLTVRLQNAEVTVQQQELNGNSVYIVERSQVPAIRAEENYPPGYTPYAWMDYSEYADWPAVAAWAQGLYRGVAKDSQAVNALARRLKAESQNTADFIAKTLFFVQSEIRYLGLELGENTHLPNAPSTVLSRRYGDCKDKSLLISELLRRGGVKAWPALVSTQFQGLVTEVLPSPGVFDHVIVLVEHEGKRYWLDGTRLYQAGGLDDIGRTDYSHALVIGHPEQELVRMYPKFDPSYLIEVEEHYKADDFSGPVRLTVETSYFGLPAEAMRHRFNSQSRRDIERSYLDFYAYYLSGIRQAKPMEYVDDPAQNRVLVKETYDIEGYWQQSEKGMKAPVVLAAFTDMLIIPRQVDRIGPYYLGVPKTIRSNTYIHYPIDVGLKFDSSVTEYKDPAFSYVLRDEYAGRVYRHRAILQIHSGSVPVERMTSAISTIRKVRDNWEFSITTPKPEELGYGEYVRLRSRLQDLAGGAGR